MVRKVPAPRAPRALLAALLACLLVPGPAQAGEALVGLEERGDYLVTFDSFAPGVRLDRTRLLELPSGVTLKGIDFDPASGLLLGFGSDGRVYIVYPTTGVVTAVGDGTNVDARIGSGGAAVGFDIEPGGGLASVVDTSDRRARYVLPAGTPEDPPTETVAPAGSALSALAYSGSDLFGIAAGADMLVRVGASGMLTDAGPLGVDVQPSGGFDVLGDNALAALAPPGERSKLYAIDLGSGAATGGFPITAAEDTLAGLAIAPAGSIQLQSTSVVASESARFANLIVERFGGDGRPTAFFYQTFNGSARAGEDYVTRAGSVGFGEGQRTALIQVPISNDRLSERFETLGVALGLPSGNAILARQRAALVTIVSDDEGVAGPPKASFESAGRVRKGSKAARFNFICSEPCGVRTDLKLGRRIIGSGEAVGGTTRRPLTVRFTNAGVRALRGAKAKDRLRLAARVTDRQGQRTTITTRVPRS